MSGIEASKLDAARPFEVTAGGRPNPIDSPFSTVFTRRLLELVDAPAASSDTVNCRRRLPFKWKLNLHRGIAG